MQCPIYHKVSSLLNPLNILSLLSVRLILAYGFYEPSIRKWSDIGSVAEWFGSIGIPLPVLSAYMAASTELLGVILLTLGFFTRLISIPLMVVMVVAIFTVHLGSGFSAVDGGFEIPLYYLIFLFVLSTFGAGKASLDYVLFEKNA